MPKSKKDSVNDMKSDQDSLSNKQLLNRKKKRDSNISSEIFDQNSSSTNEIKCSICLGEDNLISNCYKCSTCYSYFHLECYNLFTLPKTKEEKINKEKALNNFECYRCRQEKEYGEEFKCFVCKAHSGIIKKLEEKKFLHLFCYVFFKDNLNNLKREKCKLCSRKDIPVLKCENPKCNDKYHIQCAIDQKIIFCLPYMRTTDIKLDENNFNEKIPFYCEIHNNFLSKNFKEYSLTMNISKNDKILPEITGEEKKEKDKEEINNKKNNGEEEECINNKEQKELNKKSIITSLINLNVTNEVNPNSNMNIVNNINKESEEKEKNNSNYNLNNNNHSKSEIINDSGQFSPNTPVKINLSNQLNKNVSSEYLNNDINNISLKKEKSSMIEDVIDININVDKKNVNNINDEIEEDMEYTSPEIKYEDIDLFENFKNRNEKYVFPGAFYKINY